MVLVLHGNTFIEHPDRCIVENAFLAVSTTGLAGQR